MAEIVAILQIIASFSPLAVIALLGVIILFQVRGKRVVALIKKNDLHQLPMILETLQRIEVSLAENFSAIRAKLNGR